jgi:hypothetical protein
MYDPMKMHGMNNVKESIPCLCFMAMERGMWIRNTSVYLNVVLIVRLPTWRRCEYFYLQATECAFR